MKAAEVQDIVAGLLIDPEGVAREFNVSERTVRRWLTGGVTGPPAAALRYAKRLAELGVAWRQNEVAIALTPKGVVRLSDYEAVQRHAALTK